MTPASPHDTPAPHHPGSVSERFIPCLGAEALISARHRADAGAVDFQFPKYDTLLKWRDFWMLTASKLVVIQVRTHETRPGPSASHPCARMVQTSLFYWEGQTTVSAARESN